MKFSSFTTNKNKIKTRTKTKTKSTDYQFIEVVKKVYL